MCDAQHGSSRLLVGKCVWNLVRIRTYVAASSARLVSRSCLVRNAVNNWETPFMGFCRPHAPLGAARPRHRRGKSQSKNKKQSLLP